jgi:hypothetical protein
MIGKANRIVLILAILLMSGAILAQEDEIWPLKYNKIYKAISKKKSEFFYPQLFERYLALDTTLSVEEFRHLYYGFTFREEYRPYATPYLQDSLLSYLSRENMYAEEYEVAARLAGELLRQNPFRLRETFIAAVSYEMAGNQEMSSIYFSLYEKQVDAIMSTGDGLSVKTAFTVIYVQDEYELLELLGFRFGGNQQLLKGGYDMLHLEDNNSGITALYFDVGRILEVGFN